MSHIWKPLSNLFFYLSRGAYSCGTCFKKS